MTEHEKREPVEGQGADRLEEELARLPRPAARPEFKEELRSRFVHGEEVEGETVLRKLTHGLDELPMSPAPDDFREKLRSQFVSGSFTAVEDELPELPADSVPVRPAAPGQRVRSPRPTRTPRRAAPPAPRRPRGLKVAATLTLAAAAAALVLIVKPPITTADEVQWHRIDVTAEGKFLARIHEWQEVTTGENERMRLAYDSNSFVEIAPSTQVKRVERDGELPCLSASRGALYLSAPDGTDPVSFQIETPDAVLEIRARAIGIDIYPEGTCVCVLDGEVELTPRLGDPVSRTIHTGGSCFLQREGGLMVKDGLFDDHVTPIESLREFAEGAHESLPR